MDVTTPFSLYVLPCTLLDVARCPLSEAWREGNRGLCIFVLLQFERLVSVLWRRERCIR